MIGVSFRSTKAEDGDLLDVLLIHNDRTYPGVILRCKPHRHP